MKTSSFLIGILITNCREGLSFGTLHITKHPLSKKCMNAARIEYNNIVGNSFNTTRVYNFKSLNVSKLSSNCSATKKVDSFQSLDEKLKFVTSSLFDSNLLNKTIEEWRRPLPKEYLSRPLVIVGTLYTYIDTFEICSY